MYFDQMEVQLCVIELIFEQLVTYRNVFGSAFHNNKQYRRLGPLSTIIWSHIYKTKSLKKLQKFRRTHGTPYHGYGYVPLRFEGNVVRRMGTQEQQQQLQELRQTNTINFLQQKYQ